MVYAEIARAEGRQGIRLCGISRVNKEKRERRSEIGLAGGRAAHAAFAVFLYHLK